MAVAFGPTSCFYVLVPKSKLLHRPEKQDGFVPKHTPKITKLFCFASVKVSVRRFWHDFGCWG